MNCSFHGLKVKFNQRLGIEKKNLEKIQIESVKDNIDWMDLPLKWWNLARPLCISMCVCSLGMSSSIAQDVIQLLQCTMQIDLNHWSFCDIFLILLHHYKHHREKWIFSLLFQGFPRIWFFPLFFKQGFDFFVASIWIASVKSTLKFVFFQMVDHTNCIRPPPLSCRGFQIVVVFIASYCSVAFSNESLTFMGETFGKLHRTHIMV